MTKIWLEPGSINCTCCQDIPGCKNVPKEETDLIVDAVCAKLQSRSAMGIKKYGTTLAGNPATVKEKLVHIQEELMDAANYVEWLLQDYSSYGVSPAMEAVKMMEKEMPTPMTIEMEADAKQAALASLKMEYELNGSNPYNWFIRDYYKTVVAALQLPRVPVIPGLDEAIKHFDGVSIRGPYYGAMFEAARAYAELQKGC